MPGGDGTGPGGMGPMTGRAAGYCAGYPAPGYMNPIAGRGFRGGGRGMGWGRGRGWGRGFTGAYPGWAPAAPVYGPTPFAPTAPNREQEVQALKGQAEYFTSALENIKGRIGELEAETETDK